MGAVTDVSAFSDFVLRLHERSRSEDPAALLHWSIAELADILHADCGWAGWADLWNGNDVEVCGAVAYGLPDDFQSFWDGIRREDLLAARSMGASSLRIFRDVIFFETLPQTFVGLRTAVSLALVVIIVAEMFIGATDGMGHRIIDAQISYSLTDMYGSILIAGALGYGLNLVLLFLERSLIHWSGK